MGKIHPVLIIVTFICGIAFCFLVASNRSPKPEKKEYTNPYDLRTIEFDGCEYVGNSLYGGNAVLTHKGNCKNCSKKNIN